MDKIVQNLATEIKSTHGLNFKDANTHKYTNGDHPYPASMIPQLPDLFLKALLFNHKPYRVLDPFAGSGTTLVESKHYGVNSVGIDLNPLAVLISKVKTTYLNPKQLQQYVNGIKGYMSQHKSDQIAPPKFFNIKFWFKPQVIHDLTLIKQAINKTQHIDSAYRNFALVAFSYTIRKVSNSRNGEFKLYRMPKDKLAKWSPDTIKIFLKILKHNQNANKSLRYATGHAHMLFGDSKHLPLKDHSCDAVITSPPYGDSRTTVAYGQFSRLELQWIGDLHFSLFQVRPSFVRSIDRHLLGGNVSTGTLQYTDSDILNQILFEIAVKRPKRAYQVRQFYADLDQSLKELKRVMKPHSHLFFVTGNRTVCGIQLPTNKIITQLFANMGIRQVGHFTRTISSKRMPSKNSPSNARHKDSKTMSHEDITIYRT